MMLALTGSHTIDTPYHDDTPFQTRLQYIKDNIPKCFANTTSTVQWICKVMTIISFSWSLLYVTVGGGTWGVDWYRHMSGHIFQDAKGGVPLLTMAIPLFITSSLSTLLLLPLIRSTSSSSTSTCRYTYSNVRVRSVLHTKLIKPFHNILRTGIHGGDLDFRLFGYIFISLPCILYLLSYITRKLYGHHDKELDWKLKEIGNAFAFMGVMGFSFYLIPVARHSVILDIFGWSQIHAVRLHIIAGRIGVFGGVIHGVFHVMRWHYAGESVWRMSTPDKACWEAWYVSDAEPICVNEDSDCGCYDLMRNFTGVLAGVALLVILGSSVGFVRRRWYRVFYGCHVVFGVLGILGMVIHYNRLILYICPSLLYYATSTAPVLVQACASYFKGGTRLVQITHIPDSNNCIELCFDVSSAPDASQLLRMAACPYVKLCVPELSFIWHPFTVFPGPPIASPSSDDDGVTADSAIGNAASDTTVRILFRATGLFTISFLERLLQCSPSPYHSTPSAPPPPKILMDGFYGKSGITDRIDQALKHDTVVMVAGGIGITPFLSLVPLLYHSMCDRNLLGYPTKRVTLHWICRDEGLISHVVKHYLSKIADDEEEGNKDNDVVEGVAVKHLDFDFDIVIHHTGQQSRSVNHDGTATESDGEATVTEHGEPQNMQDSSIISSINTVVLKQPIGSPMIPARFSSGSKLSIPENIPSFLAFSSIVWLGLYVIWMLYLNVHSKEKVWSRSFSLFAILGIAIICSAFSEKAMEIYTTSPLALEMRQKIFNLWGRVVLSTGRLISKSMDMKAKLSPKADLERSAKELHKMGLVEMSSHESRSLSGLELMEEDNSDYGEVDYDDEHDYDQPESSHHHAVSNDSEPTVLPNQLVASSNPGLAMIEHRDGRPSFEAILDFVVVGAEKPGLFVCGPINMLNDIKRVVGRVTCVCYRSKARCAVYEETFSP